MEEKQIISEKQLVTDWAKYCVEHLKEQIESKGVHKGDLDKSIIARVTGGETPDGITVEFKKYGRFVDMGVGRGVPKGSRSANIEYFKHRNLRGQLHQYKRKAKKWYTKPFAAQVHRLTELLYEHFNSKGISVLENSLNNTTIKINL